MGCVFELLVLINHAEVSAAFDCLDKGFPSQVCFGKGNLGFQANVLLFLSVLLFPSF